MRLCEINKILPEAEVDAFKDGRYAWEAAQKSRYDLVITDIMMRFMHGDELAAKIHGLCPDIPILFETGESQSVLLERGIQLERCIYKPVRAVDCCVVIAQAKDNDYYLRRLLDGTEASGGTLFMDFRNNKDLSDWNTVIYGHNMKNGTMFATLLDYRRPGYYDKHPVMYLYTLEQRYKIELIAGYTTSVNDLIYSIPATKESRDEILDHARMVSSFISDVTVEDGDRLVTLSTCSYVYDDARYVVIGRIVEE